MGGNGDGVNPESSCDLRVPQLGLGILGRSSGQLQKRGMGAPERVPAHPRDANLLPGGFQVPEKQIGVVESRALSRSENPSFWISIWQPLSQALEGYNSHFWERERAPAALGLRRTNRTAIGGLFDSQFAAIQVYIFPT